MGYRILALAGALAIGYWIMMKAANEKGKVKTAGQVAAWIIMVIAIISLLFSGYFTISKSCKYAFRSHRRGKSKGHYRSYKRHSEKEDDDDKKDD